MKTSIKYVVIDSNASVEYAFRKGQGILDLIESICISCRLPVYLTAKLCEVIFKDEPLTGTTKLCCLKCHVAKQRMN